MKDTVIRLHGVQYRYIGIVYCIHQQSRKSRTQPKSAKYAYSDCEDVTSSGRAYQVFGPATGKPATDE